MDPHDIFSPTRPRTPTTHPYPYAFPTSSFRDGPPPSQFQNPSPFPHPENPRPQPNQPFTISPTSPLTRPQLGSILQDDGDTVETKPPSEPEARTEGPRHPPTHPRPPNIKIPSRISFHHALKGDSQVEVPESKPEMCMKHTSHPSRRPDSLVADVQKWLAGVADKVNNEARVGGKERKHQAPKPNGIPSPRPPQPSTPPSPSAAPCPRPRPPPPATKGNKKADPGLTMQATQGESNNVTATERDKGKNSLERTHEITDAVYTPAPQMLGLDMSETRLVISLTELQRTLTSYKKSRDQTRGKKFFRSHI